MADARGKWPPAEFFRFSLWAIAGFVFGAAFLVVGVFDLTYCIPFGSGGPTSCVYPHQGAGAMFLAGAVLSTGLGLGLADRALRAVEEPSTRTAGTSPSTRPRRPDSPVPTSWSDRLRRGMGTRSWIDDLPDTAGEETGTVPAPPKVG